MRTAVLILFLAVSLINTQASASADTSSYATAPGQEKRTVFESYSTTDGSLSSPVRYGDLVDTSSKYVKQLSKVEGVMRDLGAVVSKSGQINIAINTDVFFDFDKAVLKPESFQTLEQVTYLIEEKKPRQILIEGYTDNKGSDNYNLDLSKQRAESVKNWLIQRNKLPNLSVITYGYGETRAVAPNTNPDGSDNPEGRAKNRRVQIVLNP